MTRTRFTSTASSAAPPHPLTRNPSQAWIGPWTRRPPTHTHTQRHEQRNWKHATHFSASVANSFTASRKCHCMQVRRAIVCGTKSNVVQIRIERGFMSYSICKKSADTRASTHTRFYRCSVLSFSPNWDAPSRCNCVTHANAYGF